MRIVMHMSANNNENFNLYVYVEHRELFRSVPQPTKLINKLLAAYFEKQRQVAEQVATETLAAVDQDKS